MQTDGELADPGFPLSGGDDSGSDFSDTESFTAEMVEIWDGEVIWLFDEAIDQILTSDFSSGEEWDPENWNAIFLLKFIKFYVSTPLK